MAEITINVTSNRQGTILKQGGAAEDWDDVINASSGTSVTTSVTQTVAIRAQSFVDRGGSESFSCGRSFFYFDLSTLPSGATVTAGTFTVNGVNQSGTNAVTLTEAPGAFGTNGGSALATGDYDNAFVEDQFSDDTRGNDVAGVPWNLGTGNSGENDFQFNSSAINKINTGISGIALALVSYTYDYSESEPDTNTFNYNGVYFYTSGSFMPKIQLVYTEGGYGNTINGITPETASSFDVWQVNAINLQGNETPQASAVIGIE
jgi:hypothetical protein|tara:strand:+ start:1509 stop:2294 length:786 start_codon:yes stop_codon:yes gene_type:complete